MNLRAFQILSDLASLSRRRAELEAELAEALRETPPAAPASPVSALPEYLTTAEAAELLGVSERHLKTLRAEGRGPRYLRIGRSIRYALSDLTAPVSAGRPQS